LLEKNLAKNPQRRVATTADLDAAAVHDVLLSIYRPMRLRAAAAMRATFSLDPLLVCRDQVHAASLFGTRLPRADLAALSFFHTIGELSGNAHPMGNA
jgi:hypothetical protein